MSTLAVNANTELHNVRYGKTKVRVLKVDRPRHTGAKEHRVRELTIETLMEGDFDRSYFFGDNSTTIPTDTVKNTLFVLAKQNPIRSIEEFGVFITQHFLMKYSHVTKVHVEIIEACWDRMSVPDAQGKPQPHPFAWSKRLPEVNACNVSFGRGDKLAAITSKITNMIVLKTTENGFSGFPRCEYTTLRDSDDRLLCTSIKCEWTYNTDNIDFAKARASTRTSIVNMFATKYSNSVQKVIWDMGNDILANCSGIETVHFILPNIHHFHYDIDRFGVKNDDTIYMPTDEPSGLIQGTIARSRAKL